MTNCGQLVKMIDYRRELLNIVHQYLDGQLYQRYYWRFQISICVDIVPIIAKNLEISLWYICNKYMNGRWCKTNLKCAKYLRFLHIGAGASYCPIDECESIIFKWS